MKTNEAVQTSNRHGVKGRLTVLLVHGMGAQAGWWSRIGAVLGRNGIESRALQLPCLELAGPEAWCDVVMAHSGEHPVILIGHSLGAAVCMEVARIRSVAALVLLACPPFFPDFRPPPPPRTGLSAAARARVARFLRKACAQATAMQIDTVHFVGTTDRWVPVEQAQRLPFPVVLIPRAGHELNRSTRFAAELLHHILSFRVAREHLDRGGVS